MAITLTLNGLVLCSSPACFRCLGGLQWRIAVFTAVMVLAVVAVDVARSACVKVTLLLFPYIGSVYSTGHEEYGDRPSAPCTKVPRRRRSSLFRMHAV